MSITGKDTLKTRRTLTVDGTEFDYFSIEAAKAEIGDVSRLPFSMKVLLENLLRYEDGRTVSVDDVKAVLSGMLAPEIREKFLGNAEILEVFDISKVGKVAGCRVTDGVVRRGAKVRLIRDNVVVHEGELSTLKRFKDEVREVQTGQECGMAFANYQDMKKGDVIECFEVETVQRAL